MNWQRFVLVSLLEVVRDLVFRLGVEDLVEKCDACRAEVDKNPE